MMLVWGFDMTCPILPFRSYVKVKQAILPTKTGYIADQYSLFGKVK